MKYPIKSKELKDKQKKDYQTYNFVFKHKEQGFRDYEKDKFAINSKINKQLEDTYKLSDKKISVFRFNTSPFLADTKITIEFRDVDRKTAEKIAKMNGWKLL